MHIEFISVSIYGVVNRFIVSVFAYTDTAYVSVFAYTDTAYVLAYPLSMLNTDGIIDTARCICNSCISVCIIVSCFRVHYLWGVFANPAMAYVLAYSLIVLTTGEARERNVSPMYIYLCISISVSMV